MDQKDNKETNKDKKIKRIVAWSGIIVLVSIYLVTFVSAIFTTEATPELFKACIFCSIIVPILMYGYLLVYNNLKKK